VPALLRIPQNLLDQLQSDCGLARSTARNDSD
jgi:hypothetical protein